MEQQHDTEPGTTPVPVNDVRRTLYEQSYGKHVGPVTTLFAAEMRDRPESDGSAVAVDTSVLEKLRNTRAGASLTDGVPLQDRVLAAAVEAVRVRRLTPADKYQVHRAYPSPRGLFGVDLHVEGSGGGGGIAVVDPQEHTLSRRIQEARCLRLSMHPERYPSPYGSLRPTLAQLEAGHLAATLALTLHRAGVRSTTRFTALKAEWLFEIGINDERITEDAVGPGDIARLDAAVAPNDRPLVDWLDRRTSGWSRENLVTSELPDAAAVNAVSEGLQCAMAAVRDVLPSPDALRLYRHRLIDSDGRRHEHVRLDSESSNRDGQTAAVPFVSALGYSLTVDAGAWIARYGQQASAILHAVLGWVAQWGCLASAAVQLTARPARNFGEAEWGAELALPLRHTVGYQLWLRPRPAHGEEHTVWSLGGVTV